MGQPKAPEFNPAKDLKKSTQVYLKYLPQVLEAEQAARTKYDPSRIEEQQQLQDKYGTKQYAQQLSALQQLDPQGVAIRKQLGTDVTAGLTAADAGVLPPGLQQAWDAQSGGRAVAYGNTTGAAPQAFANIFNAQNLLGYRQQQMQNAAGFLGLQTPEQAIMNIQPVTPDRASAYVNPSAPAQAAQSYYQNRLAQQQLSQGSGSGGFWGQAIGGTLGGVLGGVYGGPAGSQLGVSTGSAVGGAVGGYFSSRRIKTDIQKIGETAGLGIYEFRYKRGHTRYRGVMADEVERVKPEAVTNLKDGSSLVNYEILGIPFEKQCRDCKSFKNIDNFQRRANCESRDGHRNTCIECINIYKRRYYGEKHAPKWRKYHYDYYRANKDTFKDQALQRDFGITLTDYKLMVVKQGGLCAICHREPSSRGLMVDHCHTTGTVRGLLCHHCNAGLGAFREDAQALLNAIGYLKGVT